MSVTHFKRFIFKNKAIIKIEKKIEAAGQFH